MELLQGQADVEGVGVQKCMATVMFSRGEESLRHIRHAIGAGDGDIRRDDTGRKGMFSTARRVGLATNCISCCSCAVRAARVVLMLFSETCCLSMSS